ncbi:ABC transporter ATP-binding protein [Kiloniella antarctica]|uniref:ABC transporter ATP-binding protein n=1 Tax=Kiloniella antarctica TaxID=1550907 RepID=A0ABW5BL48_9PROT
MYMISEFRNLYNLLDLSTRRRLPVSAFFGVLISIFEMLGLSMVMPFLVIVAEPDNSERFGWLIAIVSPFGAETKEEVLLYIGVGMAGMFMLKNVLVIFVSWWQTRFLAEGESKLSINLVRRYTELPYLDVTARNSSELIRNAVNNVQMAISSFLLATLSLVTELLIVCGVALVIFLANAKLALGLVVFFSIVVVVFYAPLRNRFSILGEGLMRNNFLILKALKEGIGAIKEVRILNREKYFLDTFSAHRTTLGQLRAQHSFLTSIGRPYLEIMMLLGIGIAATTILSGLEIGEIIGVIGLVGAAGLRVMPSVNRILTLLQQIRVALPSVRITIKEFKMTEGEKRSGYESDIINTKLQKGIEVCDLHFSYPERDVPALKGLSLIIPTGRSVGIVGASGSGKSTLVNVMLGLIDPGKGNVLIDGVDIRKDLSEWRQRVGYVPQSVYLTDATVRGNVAFGVPDGEIKEELLSRALRLAHFDEVLADLPMGLDTVIGEEGVRLSGGQRQRIGIARALYNNPDVLIFDEATSALDNMTESKISRMIHDLSGTKTIIIIAHRLSTIQNCNNVVMLRDGKKISEGSFDNLAEECDDFKVLLESGGL